MIQAKKSGISYIILKKYDFKIDEVQSKFEIYQTGFIFSYFLFPLHQWFHYWLPKNEIRWSIHHFDNKSKQMWTDQQSIGIGILHRAKNSTLHEWNFFQFGRYKTTSSISPSLLSFCRHLNGILLVILSEE